MKKTREEIAEIRHRFVLEALKHGYGRRRARSEARHFVRRLQAVHSLEEIHTMTLEFSSIFAEPNSF